jgi:hypothetical protein
MRHLKVKLQTCIIAACLLACSACNNYLDIVPDDGVASLATAFTLRSSAIKYLTTCYSFLPRSGHPDTDHGLMTGDELWGIYDRRESDNLWNGSLFNIARGFQSANNPYGNDWDAIYQGIRCCNILIEEVGTVPDLPEWERLQWIAEVKFLKAWYHFHLVCKWGPIPIIRENLPINASVDEVRVSRNPVDECFDYIFELIDEAIPDLPLVEQSRDEWGRITKPIAAAAKAKIAVYAASPLFNNNVQQSTLANKDGTRLFATKTPEEAKARWDYAVTACSEAIRICDVEANKKLFTHQSRWTLNDTLLLQLDIRNVLTEKWNDEIIWTNTQTRLDDNQNLQQCTMPNFRADIYPDVSTLFGHIQPPLKIVEMFYTNHGLPIENDKAWDTVNPYVLKQGGDAERWYIAKDYTTVKLNFDREPRFYAWLGFDGGIWYGQQTAKNDPVPGDLLKITCRAGGVHRKIGYDWGPLTGYYPKKLVHYENVVTGANSYSITRYPWPMLRLADLYLLYAEAINEAEGPNGAHSSDMFKYIDLVRSRAGLQGVKDTWDSDYSNTPGKYNAYEGMKEIIHRERLVELVFEGQRFWDLRRWKEVDAEYAKGIYGFKVTGTRPEDYYQKLLLAEQKFGLKDYFSPIATALIEQNPNLVQNTGW